MQKLLIIGGTRFIGRNLIEALLPLNQFEITLFNRGITNPELFPDLKRLRGDRYTDDIKIINQQSWDYIIDLSCYFPKSIELILQHLKNPPKRYIYLSSISVYQVLGGTMQTEELLLQPCTEEEKVDTTNYTYGVRQAECDRLLERAPFDYLILRPSIIYGPYDYTDRFYYWLYQMKTRAEVLIPGDGQHQLGLTYIDDLIRIFIESLGIKDHRKTYNIVSHEGISIRQIVEEAGRQLGTSPQLVSGSQEFLLAHQISPMSDLPLWIRGDYFTFSNKKMTTDFKSKLSPFVENMAATIAYYDRLGWPPPSCGISVEKQDHLIAKILQ